MSRPRAYRTIGFLLLRGGRLYVRLRYPNLLRKLITVVGSVAAVGLLIALVSALTGRSNVNAMTP